MNRLTMLRRVTGGHGGAEKVASRFETEFARAGWEVQFISAGQIINGTHIQGDRGPGWWRTWQYARSVNRLRPELEPCCTFSMERGPLCDVYRAGEGVHLRWLEILGASPFRRLTNPLHWIAPRLEQATLASAKWIVANSQMIRQEIERFYPEHREKVRVVYNGYDPEVFFPPRKSKPELRQSLGLPATGLLLVFSGSGWSRKGLATSVQLLSQMAAHDPSAQLVVLGKGKTAPYEALAASLGVASQVHFLGHRDQIADYYRAGDALVLPTLYDPFSNSCLEALACGLPVITTKHNGVAEVIEPGVSGCLIPVDGADLTQATNFLLNLSPDSDRIAASVSHLTAANEREALLGIFAEVLAQTHARSL